MSDNSYIQHILDAWSSFTTDDNKNNDVIDLNSWSYTFSRYNDKIIKLSETYNIPSEITVIYLKNLFEWYLQKSSISLKSLLYGEFDLHDINTLFELFHEEAIKDYESQFYSALTSISASLVKDKLIGEIDFSDVVEHSLDVIFDELMKCRLEIYQKGSDIGSISTVSRNIYVFNTLVECLSVLQTQPDSVYVCYISNHNTSDGYFGFFIKNNGNIFSINERVPEAFIGQHQHGRNHRFVENKPSGVFPYELFNFSNYDYKGYATTYELKDKDNKCISLADLSQKSYITLLIIILMLKCRFENKQLEGDIVLSNFYLKGNVNALSATNNNELVALVNNPIVSSGETALSGLLDIFTTESVKSGELNSLFDKKVNDILSYSEHGYFGHSMFIDMYAQDFELDKNKLLIDPTLKLVGDGNKVIDAEFVGTPAELLLQSYNDARKQLANHIKSEMSKEYESFNREFGNVSKWWHGRIEQNIDKVRDFVIQAYVDAKHSDSLVTYGWRSLSRHISVSYTEDDYNYRRELDFYNNKPCTCCIHVRVTDWTDIELILGEPVPKIIKGYTEDRKEPANSLLNVVDPVLQIKTPFEMTGSFSIDLGRYDFPLTFYFSRSGLRKYIKDKRIVPNN